MQLVFPDSQVLDDLRAYVLRARTADETGAIRLQASGTTLAAYVGVLPGTGLMAEGAVMGLRAIALAEPLELDTTVSLAALGDRLARGAGLALPVPPTTVRASWSAMAPPRSGWERVGKVSSDALSSVARQGIAQIATGAPTGAGGHGVAALRRQVWARPTSTTPPVPAGAAFAAYVLGFCRPGEVMTVWAHGRWTRLSAPAGHVLMR